MIPCLVFFIKNEPVKAIICIGQNHCASYIIYPHNTPPQIAFIILIINIL